MWGFHKDTKGQTLFVNLNFVTSHSIAGPEYILNPPAVEDHDSQIGKTLPREFFQDIKTAQKELGESNIIRATEIPAHGVVAFVDELIHHSTPLYGHRTVPGKFVGESFEADRQYSRPELLEAGLSDEQIDALMTRFDPTGRGRFPFERVKIANVAGETGVDMGFHQPLKREMSERALKGGLPPEVTGERQFFRTWVRAVPIEDIALSLLSEGHKDRAVARKLKVKSKQILPVTQHIRERVESGELRKDDLLLRAAQSKRPKELKPIFKSLGVRDKAVRKEYLRIAADATRNRNL